MTPAPISPSPVVPLTAVSGGSGNTTVSGISPVSGYQGPSGIFTGPHFIEEQTLNVDYFRVPSYYFNNVQPTDFSLSAASPMTTHVSGNVQQTSVWARVTASVSIVKNYDRYGTSSYQQPQKFQVLAASADTNGNDYGAVTPGSLGPAGTILTSQKFYNRRPWETTDVETDDTTIAFSYKFNPSGGINGAVYTPGYGQNGEIQSDAFGNHWLQAAPKFPELWLPAGWLNGYNNSLWAGRLTGPYLAANDQVVFTEHVLDAVGESIANGNNLYYGPLARQSTDYSIALGRLSSFDTSAGGNNPAYDITRHDYS
tara:strand:+ start:654 stop:1589 length:936 start_codon:yes stop_codon:yes gene_type:complete